MSSVAKPKLRFLKRSGRDITIADNAGHTHHATLTRPEDLDDVDNPVSVREDGSFSFGYCKSCNWVGPARRARGKARRDTTAHLPDCPGKAKVRIGVTEDQPPRN